MEGESLYTQRRAARKGKRKNSTESDQNDARFQLKLGRGRHSRKGSMPPFASLPARHFHPNRTVVLSCFSVLVYPQFYRQFNLLFLVFLFTNRSSTLSSIELEGRIDGKSVLISSYFYLKSMDSMWLNAPLNLYFASFSGCAFHFAGRYVLFAWARLRLRLDPPPCEGCFLPIWGMCAKLPPLDSLNAHSQLGGGNALLDARGKPPTALSVVGSLNVWGRFTFVAPPMPTDETLGRLHLSASTELTPEFQSVI